MNRFVYECETASVEVVPDSIEFKGETYTADKGKAFVLATLCTSLPTVNTKGRTLTAATIANSFASAQFQLLDFEHRIAAHAPTMIPDDQIVGSIVGVDFPEKDEAVAMAAAGDPVPLKVLYVVYKKAKGVTKFLVDMAADPDSWKSSFEIHREKQNDALAFADKGEFVAWETAAEDMRSCVSKGTVKPFDERPMALALGGEDGVVQFTGAALTRVPADKTARVDTVAASAVEEPWLLEAASMDVPGDDERKAFVMRWKGAGGQRSEVRGQKSEEEGEAEGEEEARVLPVIGTTDEQAGHAHDVLADLSIGDVESHRHWTVELFVAPADGVIRGETDRHTQWQENETDATRVSIDVSHRHQFTIVMSGAEQASTVDAGAGVTTDPLMEKLAMTKETAAAVVAALTEIASGADEARKQTLLDLATQVEQDENAKTVDEAIAEQVQSGDLVPKETHAQAVASAGDDAVTQFKADLDAAHEAKAARLTEVEAAGLKPEFKVEPDKTIETVVATMPVGEEGDTQFASVLVQAQWLKQQLEQAGQEQASEANSGENEPTVTELGGQTTLDDGTPEGKKPIHAYL